MPSNVLELRYHFQNVGQGLFASGRIDLRDRGNPRLVWVYDCGTNSPATLVTTGIGELGTFMRGRSQIDLVALSHFDRDHISGVAELIATHPVDIVLLPYVPLWKRLLIAIAEGVPAKDPLLNFFIDPVAYLAAASRSDETRYVLYLPGGEAPPPGAGAGVDPDITPPDEPRRDEADNDVQDDDDRIPLPPGEPAPEVLGGPGLSARVTFLKGGTPVPVEDAWEFLPYNDDTPKKISKRFEKAVAARRDALIATGANVRARKKALEAIKSLYDVKFGASAKDRNVISLHLYGGLLPPAAHAMAWLWVVQSLGLPEMWAADRSPHKTSILYTGDGYLNTTKRLTRLLDYMGTQRIQNIGVFQVMHHGAEDNWREGIAKAIAPAISVFSSDPQHKRLRHPHGPVIRDFLPFTPVLVDKVRPGTFVVDFYT